MPTGPRLRPLILPILAVGLAWATGCQRSPQDAHPTLRIHVAVSLGPAVREVATAFAAQRGCRVEFEVGGSGALLARLRVDPRGDLFVPAEDSYADEAAAHGLVLGRVVIAGQRPCIGVRRGNPHAIAGLADLLRDDVRLGLTLPESAAIGRVAAQALRDGDLWNRLVAKAVVMKPTVNGLANDLTVGSIDAAIVWRSTVAQYAELEAVSAGPLSERFEPVPALVLTCSTAPELAHELAQRLAAPPGQAVLVGTGLEPAP